ncbi:MAG: hypothetical protein PHE67_00180 [Campylobacterales bacterium]|nr:hypothetical protein [Campylobacterales bacterium]
MIIVDDFLHTDAKTRETLALMTADSVAQKGGIAIVVFKEQVIVAGVSANNTQMLFSNHLIKNYFNGRPQATVDELLDLQKNQIHICTVEQDNPTLDIGKYTSFTSDEFYANFQVCSQE